MWHRTATEKSTFGFAETSLHQRYTARSSRGLVMNNAVPDEMTAWSSDSKQ
jgi:hypothetical protein